MKQKELPTFEKVLTFSVAGRDLRRRMQRRKRTGRQKWAGNISPLSPIFAARAPVGTKMFVSNGEKAPDFAT